MPDCGMSLVMELFCSSITEGLFLEQNKRIKGIDKSEWDGQCCG